ncbi:hypothetical protein D3C87_904630 [compost metagenome]
MISVWLFPSAGSDVSATSIVLVSVDGAPITNCTLAVDVSGTPLILALTVAVPISVGAVRSAVYVPSPLSVTELTVPDVEVIANKAPPFFTSLPYVSFSLTVTRVLLVPSAGSVAAAVSTVLVPVDGSPATSRTAAVFVSGLPPTLALTVAVPTAVGAVSTAVYVPSPLSVTGPTVPSVEVTATVSPPLVISLPWTSLSFTVIGVWLEPSATRLEAAMISLSVSERE